MEYPHGYSVGVTAWVLQGSIGATSKKQHCVGTSAATMQYDTASPAIVILLCVVFRFGGKMHVFLRNIFFNQFNFNQHDFERCLFQFDCSLLINAGPRTHQAPKRWYRWIP